MVKRAVLRSKKDVLLIELDSREWAGRSVDIILSSKAEKHIQNVRPNYLENKEMPTNRPK